MIAQRVSQHVVGMLLLPLTIAGCSPSIKVTHLKGDQSAVGNPWNLPMTQFTISITRHVTKCGPSLEGTVEVIATSSAALDEDQRYVLKSDGWWSTSDISSTLAANGVSTGLNAQSVDATATVVSNVMTTLGKVAVAATAMGVADGGESCADDVLAAVKRLYPVKGKKLKETLDEANVTLTTTTAKVALLTAQSQADANYKKELVRALEDQDTARKRVADLQRELTVLLKATSHTQVVLWPRKSSEFGTDNPFNLPRDVFAKWSSLPRATPKDIQIFDKTYGLVSKQFAVHTALYQAEMDGTWTTPKPSAHIDVTVGVPVRLARVGRLLICTQDKCPTLIPADGILNDKISQTDQVVLQMGRVYVVPLTGGTWRSQSGIIAMDSSGLPTTIQVQEKVAGAVAASGAAKDVATQLAALPADIRAAELARTKAKTEQLTAESALKTAQANLAVADQTSSLAAQLALIKAQSDLATAQLNASGLAAAQTNAQTALLNAQLALATAQANSGVINQTSVLAAQTSLLNAQTAQINAANALAKAQVVVP